MSEEDLLAWNEANDYEHEDAPADVDQDDERLDEAAALRAYVTAELADIHSRIEGTFEDAAEDSDSAHAGLEQARDRIARMLSVLGIELPEPTAGSEAGCPRCGEHWWNSAWTSQNEVKARDSAHRCPQPRSPAPVVDDGQVHAALAVAETGPAGAEDEDEMRCPHCKQLFLPWGGGPVDEGHRKTMRAHVTSCSEQPTSVGADR